MWQGMEENMAKHNDKTCSTWEVTPFLSEQTLSTGTLEDKEERSGFVLASSQNS